MVSPIYLLDMEKPNDILKEAIKNRDRFNSQLKKTMAFS
jgi:hypothetical protein